MAFSFQIGKGARIAVFRSEQVIAFALSCVGVCEFEVLAKAAGGVTIAVPGFAFQHGYEFVGKAEVVVEKAVFSVFCCGRARKREQGNAVLPYTRAAAPGDVQKISRPFLIPHAVIIVPEPGGGILVARFGFGDSSGQNVRRHAPMGCPGFAPGFRAVRPVAVFFSGAGAVAEGGAKGSGFEG